jgi:hypothetical protein
MAEAGLTRLSEKWRNILDRPLTSEEIKATINKGTETRHQEVAV